MIGHVEQSSIPKKHWVTSDSMNCESVCIDISQHLTIKSSYPTSWYHTGTLQFTYMMKDSSSDVVLMAKECEQASSLFVVPYLNKEKKYLPKMVSLKCKPNDIFWDM